MSREKKLKKQEAKRQASTRQLIGAKEITDYSLVTYGQGELVYFIVKPTNISVLSQASVGAWRTPYRVVRSGDSSATTFR